MAKYNTDNRASHEQGGNESHKDDVVHTPTLARGSGGNECSGSGIDSDAPASVGQFHDVFAEYEEAFGLSKSKRKAARSTLRDCPESETTADSIPRDVIQGEPPVAADDGVPDVEQAAETAGDNAARPSKRGIEDRYSFLTRQEIDGQGTETMEVKSQGVHTPAADCHSGNFYPSAAEPRS